ncbi:MAG: hypothetical protein LGR52_02955 [Candidatus Thiosymbion ectosymbiont of Robbea hypermnestra]|nr:hypothetical protein [Candidatus Thiosymbion ectosymbiont of Robbea hypermnestra]
MLLDECVPRKLRREITAESIKTVQEMGWAGIKNGELLRRAFTYFDVLLTTDQNIEYQQNMKSLDIAVIVIIVPQNDINFLRPLMPQVQRTLETIKPAEVKRIYA